MAKKFVIRFIAISLSLLLLIAAAVVVFDPLYRYHLPWFGLNMPLFSERYQNAGLARQLDYDAVIMGSSMVESNRAHWYDEAFGCRTLKLTFASGYMPEFDMMLSLIYGRQTLRYVFFNLDVYTLTDGSDYQYYANPEYLYDDSLWNDVQYLWNRDVLLDVFPEYIAMQDDDTPFEDAYAFADRVTFGREIALGSYGGWRKSITPAQAQKPRDAYREDCASSLSRITGHIGAHPETAFYIFLPPYSIMNWDLYIRRGQAEAVLGAIDQAAETLLAYDNVRLFCFMGAEEIVCDLDYYYDEVHFDRPASELMIAYMREGRYEMTRENRAMFMQALSDFVWRYDFDALFGEEP